MLIADYFRQQANALYRLAQGTTRAAERLELVLEAMEFEARAVDADRGKIIPRYVCHGKVSRDRNNADKPCPANKEVSRRRTGQSD